jgi:hypothetical protein
VPEDGEVRGPNVCVSVGVQASEQLGLHCAHHGAEQMGNRLLYHLVRTPVKVTLQGFLTAYQG